MFSPKVIFFISCLIVVATAQKRVGGETILKGEKKDKAVKLLETALSKLSSGDTQTYTNFEVLKVTAKVVAGDLYTYEVKFTEDDDSEKTCTITIWSRVWIEKGTELTIKCSGKPDVKVNQ